MNFSSTTKLGVKNAEIKLIIESLGGKLVTNIGPNIVALISNKGT